MQGAYAVAWVQIHTLEIGLDEPIHFCTTVSRIILRLGWALRVLHKNFRDHPEVKKRKESLPAAVSWLPRLCALFQMRLLICLLADSKSWPMCPLCLPVLSSQPKISPSGLCRRILLLAVFWPPPEQQVQKLNLYVFASSIALSSFGKAAKLSPSYKMLVVQYKAYAQGRTGMKVTPHPIHRISTREVMKQSIAIMKSITCLESRQLEEIIITAYSFALRL